MLKRLFSKAAASEEARRTLRYVEPLNDVRTPLAALLMTASFIATKAAASV
jgi:hypothetical protein